MRAKGARPIPSCFHNRVREKELKRRLSSQYQIKSKRAEKMLELTLSRVFLGLDESKKAEKPTLDLS
jgi:hypothetical protein